MKTKKQEDSIRDVIYTLTSGLNKLKKTSGTKDKINLRGGDIKSCRVNTTGRIEVELKNGTICSIEKSFLFKLVEMLRT